MLFRSIRTVTPLAYWWVTTQLDKRLDAAKASVEPLAKPSTKKATRRALELRAAVLASGSVTVVKYGQALSLRPEIVGRENAEALATLTDAAEPFATAKVGGLLYRRGGWASLPPRWVGFFTAEVGGLLNRRRGGWAS